MWSMSEFQTWILGALIILGLVSVVFAIGSVIFWLIQHVRFV